MASSCGVSVLVTGECSISVFIPQAICIEGRGLPSAMLHSWVLIFLKMFRRNILGWAHQKACLKYLLYIYVGTADKHLSLRCFGNDTIFCDFLCSGGETPCFTIWGCFSDFLLNNIWPNCAALYWNIEGHHFYNMSKQSQHSKKQTGLH